MASRKPWPVIIDANGVWLHAPIKPQICSDCIDNFELKLESLDGMGSHSATNSNRRCWYP